MILKTTWMANPRPTMVFHIGPLIINAPEGLGLSNNTFSSAGSVAKHRAASVSMIRLQYNAIGMENGRSIPRIGPNNVVKQNTKLIVNWKVKKL